MPIGLVKSSNPSRGHASSRAMQIAADGGALLVDLAFA